MHFGTKRTLKNNRNHTLKQTLTIDPLLHTFGMSQVNWLCFLIVLAICYCLPHLLFVFAKSLIILDICQCYFSRTLSFLSLETSLFACTLASLCLPSFFLYVPDIFFCVVLFMLFFTLELSFNANLVDSQFKKFLMASRG